LNGKADGKRKTGYNGVKLSEMGEQSNLATGHIASVRLVMGKFWHQWWASWED